MKAEYVDHMGNDLSIVNAARVSFSKVSTEFNDKDASLIRYLAKNNHWSPFAHTSISLRMSAPVPIRTQCFKHKAGFVESEESRRYISYEPKLFVPDYFRAAAANVKQGSGGVHDDGESWKARYVDMCLWSMDLYEEMIKDGVCPEQARFILPQGVMVNWIWTGNLASYARFYNQRTDPHSQKEVQDLARMVGEIIQPLFPVSWKALTI